MSAPLVIAQRVGFPGALGTRLAALLDAPAGTPRAFAVLSHCYTCTKDLKAAVVIARSLAARGVATLRFDFTGLGESAGDFADTNLTTNVEDLRRAAAWLRETHRAPALLVGHSFGGTAAILAARGLPEITAVVTLGSPADPRHLADTLIARAPDLATQGEAVVPIGGRPHRVRRQLLEDLARHDVLAAVAALDRAYLVLHAPEDDTVPFEHADRLFAAARPPRAFVSLTHATHLLERRPDAEWAGELIATWALRHLP